MAMRKMLVAIIALLVLVSACASPPNGEIFTGINQLPPDQLAAIDQCVAGYLPDFRYINLALVQDGEIVLVRGYEEDRLERANVLASVSKPVTAMIFMQLLEQGVIGAISDPIADYDPTYRGVQPAEFAGQPITFQHLLTHQSGIPHLFDLWDGDFLDLQFMPGTEVLYSSQGFGVLGAVMAHVTSIPYEQLLAQYIAAPVGADSFSASDRFTTPGGAVRVNIADLARFAIGVMNGQYVSDDTLALMMQPYSQVEEQDYCLGWYCANQGNPDFTLYHDGTNGWPRAFVQLYPYQNTALALTGSTHSRRTPQVLQDLAGCVLGR